LIFLNKIKYIFFQIHKGPLKMNNPHRRIFVGMALTLGLMGTRAMATEEPEFKTILIEGSFSLRDYPSMIAAQVLVSGERNKAINDGFRLLAGYIFGRNVKKMSFEMTAPVMQEKTSEKIKMTAPVISEPAADRWNVRFIMPKNYTLDTLPTPLDPQIEFVTVKPRRLAVVRFSGLAHRADIQKQTELLNAFILKQNLKSDGPVALAFYDPPWTLWFARRIELMVQVV
jgi:hypothetical protein